MFLESSYNILLSIRLKMDKGRYLTRIWFGLVAMVIISVPQRVISMPYTSDSDGQTVNTIRTDRPTVAGSKSMGVPVAAPTVASSTPLAIKRISLCLVAGVPPVCHFQCFTLTITPRHKKPMHKTNYISSSNISSSRSSCNSSNGNSNCFSCRNSSSKNNN